LTFQSIWFDKKTEQFKVTTLYNVLRQHVNEMSTHFNSLLVWLYY